MRLADWSTHSVGEAPLVRVKERVQFAGLFSSDQARSVSQLILLHVQDGQQGVPLLVLLLQLLQLGLEEDVLPGEGPARAGHAQ